ncbi:DUF397 domain-containing protein [Pseudonocardia sp. HH130630-07]|uniref:DUF397 domain-containing protein n=1 Tax=Pseudonocardia sp. HH130630-07 TaxID=1690815 RepID=UPI000814E3F6|nr:DUF397 domain-containing protein [Pseudonocardia sp. HH130630-07]ANY08841.1 DUF397 domain-containing protein [Pseudonocardia sp. HH130630-07]
MNEIDGAIWRKSTRSNNGGNCVEIADNLIDANGLVYVRDSKDRTGPVLSFAPAEWRAFVGGVSNGELTG